jgi:hypothetical protein
MVLYVVLRFEDVEKMEEETGRLLLGSGTELYDT